MLSIIKAEIYNNHKFCNILDKNNISTISCIAMLNIKISLNNKKTYMYNDLDYVEITPNSRKDLVNSDYIISVSKKIDNKYIGCVGYFNSNSPIAIHVINKNNLFDMNYMYKNNIYVINKNHNKDELELKDMYISIKTKDNNTIFVSLNNLDYVNIKKTFIKSTNNYVYNIYGTCLGYIFQSSYITSSLLKNIPTNN